MGRHQRLGKIIVVGAHRIKKSSPNDKVELTVSDPATKRSMSVSLSCSNPSEMWKLEVESEVRCSVLNVNSALGALFNRGVASRWRGGIGKLKPSNLLEGFGVCRSFCCVYQ